jgi:hypothetical protein
MALTELDNCTGFGIFGSPPDLFGCFTTFMIPESQFPFKLGVFSTGAGLITVGGTTGSENFLRSNYHQSYSYIVKIQNFNISKNTNQ